MIRFDNSYLNLPQRAYARVAPNPVPAPQLLALNTALAAELGLDPDWLRGPKGLAMLAGNALPPGAAGIAQAYAGHQFGGFTPQLGDGRALLIGEVTCPAGRFDIQLKGSGQTPFSRNGDGRAWLGPVLREYLISEYMARLGVPTTRALAAVLTGARVQRETALPGAILTRVAASHIRIGTFQYFAVRGDVEALAALTEHCITRHYPGAGDALGLLHATVAAQAATIAQWMALGFVHGVMNTDNMTISGQTIDYGPCAFMDGFHPDTVFSSIDRWGRYAWAEQPHVAVWNLAQFASCLIPLMGDQDCAIAQVTEAVHAFPQIYAQEWQARICAKLGLPPSPAGADLGQRLLDLMAAARMDFTTTFANLTSPPPALSAWATEWRSHNPDTALMARANPRRIPRNHQIETLIQAATAGNMTPFHQMQAALSDPFTERPEWDHLDQPPAPDQAVTRTFCGT
ncbi:MAG: YdiU family protein [Paracoccus sp. (in: a-proteobacteria)]|uniref:protein adenylyltransferase SelO n=1 Tax=Paracoccus sp. TaxID=267 RepID=UPI0026DF2AB1|nr:YdiU family protein [Paracoccus sp. (in: a-proteobacteria)]MDO5622598.1 YdiU family protein [Paracoccus sp. (in: a-proteobacteria)]